MGLTIEESGIPDVTPDWGDLKALREYCATKGVPNLVVYKPGSGFFCNNEYVSPKGGVVPLAWTGLNTDLGEIAPRASDKNVSNLRLENLVSLAMKLMYTQEHLHATYRPGVWEVSREVYSGSDPAESWRAQLKEIYFNWGKLDSFRKNDKEKEAGFEKFVSDFIAVTTDRRVVTNKEMYEVLKPHFENAEDIITDYRLGKCDPRLLFVTNAVMLAFANQYPGQNIIPQKNNLISK